MYSDTIYTESISKQYVINLLVEMGQTNSDAFRIASEHNFPEDYYINFYE